jgi:hypothetical protein
VFQFETSNKDISDRSEAIMPVDRRKMIQGSAAIMAVFSGVNAIASTNSSSTQEDDEMAHVPEFLPPGPLRENWEEAQALLRAAGELGSRFRDLHEKLTKDGIEPVALAYYCDLLCKLTPMRAEVEEMHESVSGTLGEWRDRRSGYPMSAPYQELMAEARRHRVSVALIQRKFRKEQRRILEEQLRAREVST